MGFFKQIHISCTIPWVCAKQLTQLPLLLWSGPFTNVVCLSSVAANIPVTQAPQISGPSFLPACCYSPSQFSPSEQILISGKQISTKPKATLSDPVVPGGSVYQQFHLTSGKRAFPQPGQGDACNVPESAFSVVTSKPDF